MGARHSGAAARTVFCSIAPRAVLRLALLVIYTAGIGCCAGVCLAQPAGRTNDDAAPSVLHFPADRSLGQFHTIDPETRVAQRRAARGDIPIGRGRGPTLTLNQEACNDLTPLPALVREGLERLALPKGELDAAAIDQIAACEGLDALLVLGAELTDADFAKLAKLSSLTAVSVNGSQITDQGVAELARLPRLEQLGLFAPGLSDGVWPSLIACKSIKLLSLGGGISVGSLTRLRELPRLEGLFLNFSGELSPAGLAEIGKLTNLKGLGFGSSKVSAAGLPHLAGLEQLQSLEMGSVTLTGDTTGPLPPLPKLVELRLPDDADDALLERIGEFSNLRRIDCRDQISDATLERMKTLTQLKSVNLMSGKVTDRGLQCLCQIKSLESVWLQGCAVSDDGVAELATLPLLADLILASTQVTDEGLRHLAGIRSLRKLSLQDLSGGASGQGLRPLGELTGLESLEIGNRNFHGAPLSDADLEHLLPLKNLKSLRLNHFPVSQAGLEQIVQLPALEELELSTQEVTSFDDSALELVARIPKLSKLAIGGQFTDQGLATLRQCATLTDVTLASESLGSEAIEQLSANRQVRVVVPRKPKVAAPPPVAPPPRP